jgi:hypothetical protein
MKHFTTRVLLVTAAQALACANSPPTVSVVVTEGADAHSDAESDSPLPGAALSDAAPWDVNVGPPSPLVGIRFAHWSADSPAVDVCLASHGSNAFQGPVVRNAMAAQDDAGEGSESGAPGLIFTEDTSYLYMPPGQYDARFVAAGASDCSVGIAPDATALPSLGTENGLETIALIGDSHVDGGGSAMKIAGFLDDAIVATGGLIAVRFINAAPDVPSADVGTGLVISLTTAATFFSPIFTGVPYGEASSPAEAALTFASGSADSDSHGYALVTPLAGSAMSLLPIGSPPNADTFGVRLGGTSQTELAQAGASNVAAGAVVTLVLLDTGSTEPDGGQVLGDGGRPTLPGLVPSAMSGFQLLQCLDNAGAPGLWGDCSVVAP